MDIIKTKKTARKKCLYNAVDVDPFDLNTDCFVGTVIFPVVF